MSASSKKKLRNAQNAEKLTERQLAEQAEAKKLKIYTASFVTVVALLLVIALGVGIFQGVSRSGMLERKSVAATINGESVSAVEMSYYFKDFVQNYANQNSYFLAYMLDTTAPLDQQVYDTATGETWADFFLKMTMENVRSVYALSNAAKAEGYTLTQEELASLETTFSNLGFYAQMYGFSEAEDYLKAMYGNGATMDTYRAYCERSMLANSYYSAHAETLHYDDATLREAEKDHFDEYSTFSYHSYYMATSKFLEGGTVDENGTTVYSAEENAAAEAAALEAAKALTDPEIITSVEALDLAIGALSINKGLETLPTSTASENLYTNIEADIAQWLAGDRKEGDLTYIARTSTKEDGTTEVIGYYIVWFISRNDNTMPLADVRHVLIGFEGGTTDEAGQTVYSDEEIAAARTTAEELLAQWQAGDATEESFAALAGEHSTDPGSVDNGGLYEGVRPGEMVAPFDEWCFADRKAGDTGIVQTDYGFHIMYYSGDNAITYRDQMITDKLITADMDTWYNALLEGCTAVTGDTKYLPMDMVLGG